MLLEYLVRNPEQPVDVVSAKKAFRPYILNNAEAFFERHPTIMDEVREEVQNFRPSPPASRDVLQDDRMVQLQSSVEQVAQDQATILQQQAAVHVELVRPNKFSSIALSRQQLTFSTLLLLQASVRRQLVAGQNGIQDQNNRMRNDFREQNDRILQGIKEENNRIRGDIQAQGDSIRDLKEQVQAQGNSIRDLKEEVDRLVRMVRFIYESLFLTLTDHPTYSRSLSILLLQMPVLTRIMEGQNDIGEESQEQGNDGEDL